MYTLFIILNRVEYLSEVLISLKKCGVRGATVIDSMGSKKLLEKDTQNVSFINGIVRALEGDNRTNKTIFSVIEKEEQVKAAMEEVEKILGDMNKPNKGIMFVVPVEHIRGGDLERHIEVRERRKLKD
jgi:nitrogen regulatory protein PII